MFKNLFNIILLSLILTTVLITIISYVIFRIRQIAGSRVTKGLTHLNGVYFTRYAPEIVKRNKDVLEKSESDKKDKITLRSKKAIVGSMVFLIVVLLLSLENHIHYRKEVIDRINSADIYRELIDEGLLKKYVFNPSLSKRNYFQTFTEYQKYDKKRIISSLSKFNFIVYESARDKKLGYSDNSVAVDRWLEFCNRNSLNCKKASMITNPPARTIYIVPQVTSMSSYERSILQKIINSNKSIIFSGQIGRLNGLGKSSSSEDLISTIFNVREKSGGCFPFLDLKKKGVVEYNPPATHEHGCFSPYFDTKDSSHPSLKLNNKLIWLAFDPYVGDSDYRLSYIDYKLLKLMNRQFIGFNIDLYPLEVVKSPMHVVVLISNDGDHKFLSDVIEDHSGLITLISKENSFPKEYIDIKPNLGIYGDSLVENSISTKSIFERIETTRFDLEEYSHKPVNCVWFFNKLPNAQTYDAIIQNGIGHVSLLSESKVGRFPYLLEDKLWIYPEGTISDIRILSKRDTPTLESSLNFVEKEIMRLSSVHESINIVLHQELYKNEFSKRFLEGVFELISRSEFLVPFSKVSMFQNAIKDLNIDYQVIEKRLIVDVKNTSPVVIPYVHLLFTSEEMKIKNGVNENVNVQETHDGQTITLEGVKPGANRFIVDI